MTSYELTVDGATSTHRRFPELAAALERTGTRIGRAEVTAIDDKGRHPLSRFELLRLEKHGLHLGQVGVSRQPEPEGIEVDTELEDHLDELEGLADQVDEAEPELRIEGLERDSLDEVSDRVRLSQVERALELRERLQGEE